MRSFRTFIAASLTGVVLAGLSSIAPASATVSTTTWYTNSTATCSNANGVDGSIGSGCVGDDVPGTRASGNEYKFTSSSSSGPNSGGNLMAAAYTLPNISTSKGGLPNLTTGQFSSSFLGFYSGTDYGLGVGNQSPPEHSVDNQNGDHDLVAFALPNPVNEITITISPFDTTEDMDATILWGTPDATLAAIIGTQGALGFANLAPSYLTAHGFYETTTQGLFDETGSVDISVSGPKTATYVVVSASLYPAIVSSSNNPQINVNNDYEIDDFKISSIVGTYDSNYHPRGPRCTTQVVYSGKLTPCPEPATLAMFGVGVLGLGAMVRRRKAAKAA